MDENGGWSWKNQTTIETMDQSNDSSNKEQEYFENHSIICAIFVHAVPGKTLGLELAVRPKRTLRFEVSVLRVGHLR